MPEEIYTGGDWWAYIIIAGGIAAAIGALVLLYWLVVFGVRAVKAACAFAISSAQRIGAASRQLWQKLVHRLS